jgi:hypothetical protein
MAALRQKQSSVQALEESLSEREQQLAGRERYARLHVHCPASLFCWAPLIPLVLTHPLASLLTPVPRLRRVLSSQLAWLSSHRSGPEREAQEAPTAESEDARSMRLARADDDFFF